MIVAHENTSAAEKVLIGKFFALPNGNYYPFGKESRGSSTVNEPKEGFSGTQFDDESGFNYFGARYYNPSIGRFLSTDRFKEKYPAWSPYQYAMANPLRFIDFNGDSVVISDDRLKDAHTSLYKTNKQYKAAYDKMHASEVVYTFSVGKAKGDHGSFTSKDGKSIDITIDKDANKEGSMIHEATHGEQFEDGKISFRQDENGQWLANSSIENEREAYQAQAEGGHRPKQWDTSNPFKQREFLRQNYSNVGERSFPIYGPERMVIDATKGNGKSFYIIQKEPSQQK